MGDGINYQTVAKALATILFTLLLGVGGYAYSEMNKRVNDNSRGLNILQTNVIVMATYLGVPRDQLIVPNGLVVPENKPRLGIQ